MLVYKETRTVLEQFANELKSEFDKALGNHNHTPVVKFTIYRGKIRLYITDPEELYYIEEGRGSGKFPPTPKIEDWVKRKITTDLPRVKELTFLIGRKIAEEGTEGKHILMPLIDRLNGKYELLIYDALKKDVNYHIRSLYIERMFSKL